jgi:hypothetical protein
MSDSRALRRDMFNCDNSIVRTATPVPATSDNAQAASEFPNGGKGTDPAHCRFR